MSYAARVVVSCGAAAAVLGGLATGCSSGSAERPAARPTPYSRLDASSMQIARIPFCSLVDASAVRSALGGERGQGTSWRDGDQTSLAAPGQTPGAGAPDRVQELGCAWDAGPAAARAWVFARPVDPALAGRVRAAARSAGCQVSPDRVFGDQALTQVCSAGGTTRVRHAGLFGQTWLSCEVQGQDAAAVVRRRADAWCAAVAGDLDAT